MPNQYPEKPFFARPPAGFFLCGDPGLPSICRAALANLFWKELRSFSPSSDLAMCLSLMATGQMLWLGSGWQNTSSPVHRLYAHPLPKHFGNPGKTHFKVSCLLTRCPSLFPPHLSRCLQPQLPLPFLSPTPCATPYFQTNVSFCFSGSVHAVPFSKNTSSDLSCENTWAESAPLFPGVLPAILCHCGQDLIMWNCPTEDRVSTVSKYPVNVYWKNM